MKPPRLFKLKHCFAFTNRHSVFHWRWCIQSRMAISRATNPCPYTLDWTISLREGRQILFILRKMSVSFHLELYIYEWRQETLEQAFLIYSGVRSPIFASCRQIAGIEATHSTDTMWSFKIRLKSSYAVSVCGSWVCELFYCSDILRLTDEVLVTYVTVPIQYECASTAVRDHTYSHSRLDVALWKQ